jgi:Na+/proline symporter
MTATVLPWLVMLGYGALVWRLAPRSASPAGFFTGGSDGGRAPGLWLLAASAAITWIFAKSIANSAGLAYAFGITGAIGYALYYLSFLTAGVAIYLIRTRAGDASLPAFLVRKYGPLCAKLFIAAIAIRLFNEVWSNTKVAGLYFGAEGSGAYWVAVAAVTAFTVHYTWRTGLRGSLLTDGAQMILAAVLLAGVLAFVMPVAVTDGIPAVPEATRWAGLTFCALAMVQALSYPFHDPVLTDRGFITSPRVMLKGFVLAGLIAGGFIFLFGFVGLFALSQNTGGNPTLSVPAHFGLPLLLITNAIMLTSAGSTLDSTFASTAKLVARDLPDYSGAPTEAQVRWGRYGMIAIAILGNLPLFGIYLGDRIGPAIIAATTISGTMVMGLAPIFLLAFVPGAGPASFHLAFWPGLALGVLVTVEGASGLSILPAWIDVGTGTYADDLGVNLYGLGLCTAGFLIGCLWSRRRAI